MLDDIDFRAVGGDERRFVAMPLSQMNLIVNMLIQLENATPDDIKVLEAYNDLDIQLVRIDLDDTDEG